MTRTERINIACADRDAFQKHLDDQGTATLRRAASNAIGYMAKKRERTTISADQLVGVIFGKLAKCLDAGNPIDDIEAFAWRIAVRLIVDDWRCNTREKAKVEAFSAETEVGEWRSPERRVISRDLLVKLVRRIAPVDRKTLLTGLPGSCGLDAAQRQRLCRARQRARTILAELTGEAGNCLSRLHTAAFRPSFLRN